MTRSRFPKYPKGLFVWPTPTLPPEPEKPLPPPYPPPPKFGNLGKFIGLNLGGVPKEGNFGNFTGLKLGWLPKSFL